MTGTHVMIDLETLGTEKDCAIVQIGAVRFDPKEKVVHRDTAFNAYVELDSPTMGQIQGATLKWWLTQDPKTFRHVMAGQPRLTLEKALQGLDAWLKNFRIDGLWANAPTFDLTILRTAFTRHGMNFPVSFRRERCFRTLLAMATAIDMKAQPQSGVEHDGLADAIYQADSAVIILNRIVGEPCPM